MILRWLKLQNIRSYGEQTVNFPMGTTLFEGDVGSGKSTILMAIEFALFGLGSEKGGALLKIGAKKGLVTLCFEVEGKEYEVCRSLERKAKNVQQSDCTLKTEGTILHLSASEMKEKVLDILAFNEPADPKASSVIFRYAIFTPQEEMKAVIRMSADQRLQTLRKAFRIEDYRIATSNASALTRSVKEKSLVSATRAADLETRREKLESTRQEIEKCRKELEKMNENRSILEEKTLTLRTRVAELQKTRDLLGKATGEVPLLERNIQETNDELTSLQEENQRIGFESGKIQPEIEKSSSMQLPTTKTEDELKDELNSLRTKLLDLRSIQSVIEAKIADYESVEERRVCPTCDRPADPQEFSEKIRLKKQEQDVAVNDASGCEATIKETMTLQELLREYRIMQDRLLNLRKQVERNGERMEQNDIKIGRLKSRILDAQARLDQAKGEMDEYRKVMVEAEALSADLRMAESQLKGAENRISGAQERRDILTIQLRDLETEICQKEKDRKKSERLKEYQMWLEDYLTPTFDIIEKQVMMNINQEFNQHFQKWWSMLVDDPSKESRVDEEFTPLVEQDGYEQDYNYLSGGEKTSLALAYRLSLNTIVQRVSAAIKSNLLILDEPTDGFSKEQLFKIREILDELKSPQVIMVSHEKELEGFADQVMRIEKKDGISQIKTA